MAKINIDQLASEVMKNLEIYQGNTVDTVTKAVQETAKETVAELNRTSPKSPEGGDYAKSWDKKRDKNIRGKWYMSMTVYSKDPEYRLTHLLEHGHAKVTGGRVRGKPHIKVAEDNALMRIHAKLVRNLRYRD